MYFFRSLQFPALCITLLLPQQHHKDDDNGAQRETGATILIFGKPIFCLLVCKATKFEWQQRERSSCFHCVYFKNQYPKEL